MKSDGFIDGSMRRHSYYSPILKKLGRFPLGKNINIKELGIPSGMLHKAYSEMKIMLFSGKIIDYLCWISSEYIITLYRINSDITEFTVPDDFRPLIERLHRMRQFFGDTFSSDINNFIRLAHNQPRLIISLCERMGGLPKNKIRPELIENLYYNIDEILIKDKPRKNKQIKK